MIDSPARLKSPKQSIDSPSKMCLYKPLSYQEKQGYYLGRSTPIKTVKPITSIFSSSIESSPIKPKASIVAYKSLFTENNKDMRRDLASPSLVSRKDKDTNKALFQTMGKLFNDKLYMTPTKQLENSGQWSSKLLSIKGHNVSQQPGSNLTLVPREGNNSVQNIHWSPGRSSRIDSGLKEPNYFKFVIGKGNNDQVIRKVMNKRYWWKEGSNGGVHFIWQPVSSLINFARLDENSNTKLVANHYEFHREITTKIGLIKNLAVYCEKNKLNLFDITPTTFIVDLSDPNYREEFETFLNFYKEHSADTTDQSAILNHFFPGRPQAQFKLRSSKQSKGNTTSSVVTKLANLLSTTDITTSNTTQYSAPRMGNTMNSGVNLWLLKPTEFNQGRGINLFNRLVDLNYYLKCLKRGGLELSEPNSNGRASTAISSSVNIVKSEKYVIQKYLEKPLLIDNRKFDIRVWVLVDHEMNVYCFKEKYIRLSSEEFSLDENKVTDKYIHLTNNAVQKYGKNYGKHESGNIIAFSELKKYINSSNPNEEFNKINKSIKDSIKISLHAIKDKLNANNRKLCFELFGYDYIIDSDLKTWLIEINTNPSIDESNDLLESLIPRMIDDAFRLTIDKIFTPTENNYKYEDTRDFDRQVEFPVDGYSSDENIWERISNIAASAKI